MKHSVFLLLAVTAVVTVNSSSSNCIVGCNCQDNHNDHARKLKILGCDSPITITNTTFTESFSKIVILHIENALIKSVHANALESLTDLEEIAFKDCSIGNIEASSFDLQSINGLKFTRTKFAEIPNLVSENLEEITFENCNLKQVPTFDKVPELSYLNLDNNQITDLSDLPFAKVSSLEILSMSNNSITKIPPSIFDTNSDLNTLTLDHNPLEYFRLSTVSNLESISLKNCKISVFDRSSSKNLDIVNYLDLSHNEISILPIDAFNGLKQLNYLFLSHNHLVELDDDIFIDNSNLDRIILDHNSFVKLPKFQADGDDQFDTSHFSCNHCGLKSVDKVFDNMKSLVTLSLNNNKITNIDSALNGLYDLKELSLSNNSISAIGANALSSKPNRLERLDLSGNPLKPLDPVVYSKFSELKKLDVSNAHLSKLWSNHNAILPRIERLLLEKNDLESISVEDLKIAPKLKLIDLKKNPLKCSEMLRIVIAYLIKKNVFPREGDKELKTHEALLVAEQDSSSTFDIEDAWKTLAIDSCFGGSVPDSEANKENQKVKYETEATTSKSEHYEDMYEEEYVDPTDDTMLSQDNYENPENIDLARASYILSLTSVFALSAIVVLTVAVAITLVVLKRNRSYMQYGNLPRFKFPTLHTPYLQKKHCGSVYKQLSEEHDHFRPAPVHNTIP